MDSDREAPGEPEHGKLKLYGFLIVVCLVVVAAMLLNSTGGPVVPAAPGGGDVTSGKLPDIDLPGIPGIGSTPSVPPTAVKKAGDLLGRSVDVGDKAIGTADTAVDAGTQVIAGGAKLVDDVLGGRGRPSGAPTGQPPTDPP